MQTKAERLAQRIVAESDMTKDSRLRLAFRSEAIISLLNDLDAKDAEIARIIALNTQQAIRMAHLTVLAVGCSEHSSYRAKRRITTSCATCNRMQAASEALKEMAKEEAPNG